MLTIDNLEYYDKLALDISQLWSIRVPIKEFENYFELDFNALIPELLPSIPASHRPIRISPLYLKQSRIDRDTHLNVNDIKINFTNSLLNVTRTHKHLYLSAQIWFPSIPHSKRNPIRVKLKFAEMG